MTDHQTRLELEQGRWYAWEMLPGYTGDRYFSPIRIGHIEALKTGRDLLRLHFYNAFYAEKKLYRFSTQQKVLEQLFIQVQALFHEQFYLEGYRFVGKLLLRVLIPYQKRITFDKAIKGLKS